VKNLYRKAEFRRRGRSPVKVRKGLRYAVAGYSQIVAVFGALTIATFVGHFVSLDWKGALAQITGVWDTIVRPLTVLSLNAVFLNPCKWLFGIDITIPVIWRDYIEVGIVLAISGLRVERKPYFTVLFSGMAIAILYTFQDILLFVLWLVGIFDMLIFIMTVYFTIRNRIAYEWLVIRSLRKEMRRYEIVILYIVVGCKSIVEVIKKMALCHRLYVARLKLRRTIRSKKSRVQSWMRR
jgi:hypothetical protein